MDEIWEAANALAALMRPFPWYHRTTFAETRQGERWTQRLFVWGDVAKPVDVPQTFRGYLVAYNRVSKRHPCPFGSVKP